MTPDNLHPQLQMLWPADRLDSPPQIHLPPSYIMRTYRPGDEACFYKIMALAGWPDFDARKLCPWLYRMLPEGWIMAVHNSTGQIAATAMATHDPTWIAPFSAELGWVAAHPAHTGRGLGQAVVAAATARMIANGYAKIQFFTEHYRLAALKIYFNLGYIPFLQPSESLETWRMVCEQLGWPFTPQKWVSDLVTS